MRNNTDGKLKVEKKSIVLTPEFVADDIYQTLKRFPFKNILDLGCFDGSMSKYFRRKKNSKIIGLDVIDDYESKFDTFIHKDFLECTKEDFKDLKIDLVVSNPPFGMNKQQGALYPDLFLKKIFEIFGDKMPVVLIAGHWFISNNSSRIQYLNSLNITKNTTLHKNAFAGCGVSVEANILYFNIRLKDSLSVLDVKKVEKKQKFKTVAFSEAQMIFMKDNIDNFSGTIKKLIKSEYPDFPM
jgi:predicted RNA methylase